MVWSVISILAVLTLFTERPYLRRTFITNNARAKKPVANYTGHVVDDAVQKSLIIGVIVTLLVVVILILLAQLAWRGRSWARWALIGMASVPGVFFGVGVIGQLAFGTLQSSPGLHKFLTIAAGFASLVVVALLVDKSTRMYFRAVRDTNRGTLPQVPATAGSRPHGGRGSGRAQVRPPVTGTAPAPAPTWAPRAGGLGGLFRKSIGTSAPGPSATSPSAPGPSVAGPSAAGPSDGAPPAVGGPDDAPTTDRPGGPPARRTSATRPGSVKAKGSGTRPGRSKSRQQ